MRHDIQFLRGFAVSIVMLNHTGLQAGAGYLGVDIFFVISGYLITRMVQVQIEGNVFSFTSFYVRRAKRLLPAAFATFALTAAAAPYYLDSIELADFREQFTGALTFTSNFVLWGQAEYFDSAAELKPLLHIWSLSLEEQYYVLLPLLLFFLRPKNWIFATVVLLVGSAAACGYLMLVSPDAAFYLLISRAWELSVGSLVALTRVDERWSELVRSYFWPSLGVLLLLPFFRTGFPHPGLDAVIVCAATAIVIIRRASFLGANLATRWLAWIGNPSYSLYLAHWPIIAFANSAYLGQMDTGLRLFLMGSGFLAGLFIYYVVERPIHKAVSLDAVVRNSWALASVGAIAFATSIIHSNAAQDAMDFAEIRKANFGLGKSCNREQGFQSIGECRTGPEPRILVWGDSFAMHLMQGLISSTELAIEQATLSACPPSVGFAHVVKGTKYDRDRAISCLTYNQQTLDYVVASSTIETVVLSSTFSYYLPKQGWTSLRSEGDGYFEAEIDPISSQEVLSSSIRKLQQAGKSVVIVTPPPSNGEDTSICAERLLSGKPIPGRQNCDISVKDDQRVYGAVLEFLRKVSTSTGAPILELRSFLCDETACKAILDGTPVYRDRVHLSAVGSEKLGATYNFAGRVLALSSR